VHTQQCGHQPACHGINCYCSSNANLKGARLPVGAVARLRLPLCGTGSARKLLDPSLSGRCGLATDCECARSLAMKRLILARGSRILRSPPQRLSRCGGASVHTCQWGSSAAPSPGACQCVDSGVTGQVRSDRSSLSESGFGRPEDRPAPGRASRSLEAAAPGLPK
jgi:hypothetical protein